jgi:hypothetical protein
MVQPCVVITAWFLVTQTAVAGTAHHHPAHKARVRHAFHQRAGQQRSHKATSGGAHREGPVQVRPDGTVVPNGLTPRIVPVPEVLKKKAPPQG